MQRTSLFFTLAAFAISANAVAPLISEMAESTGIAAPNFGLFMFLQFVAFSIASFTGGYIKQRFRFSNYAIVTAGLFVIVLSLAAGGVFLTSYLSLVVWVIPLGLSGGAVETFSSIQISRLSHADSSKSLCLSQMFYSIGAFAAPQIVYICLGMGLRWNQVFFVFAGLSALVALLFPMINRSRLGRVLETDADEPDINSTAAPKPADGRLFLVFVFIMMCYVVVESLSAVWLSYVFEKEFLITTRNAALILVGFWVGMVIGRFSIILMPTRFTLWPTLLGSSGILVVAAIALTLVPGLIPRAVAVCIFGASAGPIWPVVVMISSSTFRSDKKTAIIIGMGAIGAATGPLIGSLVVQSGNIHLFHYTQALLAAIVAVLSVTAWALFKKSWKTRTAG